MTKAAIVMGSKSDMSTMEKSAEILSKLNIKHEIFVMSAHRQPEKVQSFCSGAREEGFEVIIAGAGAAAHLPGVIASWTTIPVIGVPIPSSDLRGIDSLYSIVQMPAGIPVATMAVGIAGAKNAALFASQILGIKYPEIDKAYNDYRMELKGK